MENLNLYAMLIDNYIYNYINVDDEFEFIL